MLAPILALVLAAQLRFEPYAVPLSDGRAVDAERAELAVPERRRAAESRAVTLSVVRLRGTRPGTAGPPILYLNGSPGGAAGSDVLRSAALFPFLDRLREGGDVLVLDYRGTGLSRPRLDCPRRSPVPDDLFASRERALATFTAAARLCADSLRAAGVDLAGYTWAEMAEDVESLRRAVAAPTLRLVGFSSGTHLALAYLRAHPTHVARVVFLGTEGPDDTRKLPSVMDRQLATIDRLVHADTALARDVPDFLATVESVLARLDREPLRLEVQDPATGRTVRGTVGRFGLEFITAKSLSGPAEFDGLPRLYASLARGDTRGLVRILQGFVARPPAGPLAHIPDGASGVSPARAARIAAESPRARLHDAAAFPHPEIMEAWAVAPLPAAFRAPVRSRVPALFVTGSLDGNTPPDQAERVRAGFPRSHHLIVEGGGHDAAWVVPAALDAVVAFLDGRDVRGVRASAPPVRFAPLRR
jgi:pimeloyl-ACP methyl ester carboxylesterase